MSDASKPAALYPFKLRHERTGRWYRTRWHASLEEIERLGGEVCGAGVVYHPLGNTSNFMRAAPASLGGGVLMHPHWESPPALDSLERVLTQTFLQRYATWCLRTRRFAQAQGAASLYREL